MTCSDQLRCEILGHIDLAFDPVTSHSAIEGEPENSVFPVVPTRQLRLIAIDPAGRVTADSIAPVRTSPIVHELLDVERLVVGRVGNVDLDIPSTVDLRRAVARIRDRASGQVRKLRTKGFGNRHRVARRHSPWHHRYRGTVAMPLRARPAPACADDPRVLLREVLLQLSAIDRFRPVSVQRCTLGRCCMTCLL